MKRHCVFFLLILANKGCSRLSWEDLNNNVHLRLFTPANYDNRVEKEDIEALWNLGTIIRCDVDDDRIRVIRPSNFDSSLPIKVASGGFLSSAKAHFTNFVNQWMDITGGTTNVILVEWKELNKFESYKASIITTFLRDIVKPNLDWDNDAYNDASLNSIQVGEYVGSCLSRLVDHPNIHLVGHSLGAHLVANAGRTFELETGQKVSRITGLDPAGPGFIDGIAFKRVETLFDNRLGRDAAEFVDVIHTHASLEPHVIGLNPRFGDLSPLGHADFYPDGGEVQESCEGLVPFLELACSHMRSVHYYVNSITDPRLFPSYECTNVLECRQARSDFAGVESKNSRRFPDSYMGESAERFKTQESKLYYLKLNENEIWDLYTHTTDPEIRSRTLREGIFLAKSALEGEGILPTNILTIIPKRIALRVVEFTEGILRRFMG